MEEAQAALDGFYQEVADARKKWGIANVSVGIKDSTMDGSFFNSFDMGSALEMEAIASYVLGFQVKNRERIMAKLMAGKG